MQHYIFPDKGKTQEGDEYYATESRQWMPVHSRDVPISVDVRRPVPSAEWVSVKDRMPTKDEAGSDGDIIACGENGFFYVAPYNSSTLSGYWLDIRPPQPEQEDAFEKWWNDKSLTTISTGKQLAKDIWNAALAAGKEEE